MAGYDVLEIGAADTWAGYEGARPGKRFVEKEIPLEFIGMSSNGLAPGEQAPFWHSHSAVEEIYVFLGGRGQMGLDDDVIDVQAGTVVRVGQGVMRTWRALPDSDEDLRWLCLRAGGSTLTDIGRDGALDRDKPMPWA